MLMENLGLKSADEGNPSSDEPVIESASLSKSSLCSSESENLDGLEEDQLISLQSMDGMLCHLDVPFQRSSWLHFFPNFNNQNKKESKGNSFSPAPF